MPKKFRKMCPSDYKDPNESDSDHMDDPDYTQKAQSEPTSPKISQGKGARKRQLQKQSKSTPKSTQGGKSVTSTNILALEKQTLILPKRYRVKQDFIQKPPLGVMSVQTTINEELKEETKCSSHEFIVISFPKLVRNQFNFIKLL